MMKPYQQILIQECGEPLVAIPKDRFSLVLPHPYERLGADYQGRSPYYVRQGVLNALLDAQTYLQQFYQGWCIQIFDAYRPVEVQQFMVDYTFAEVVKAQGILESLSVGQVQSIWEKVYQIWAVPSYNLATPPPHSTGAAIDITLVDEHGVVVDMGGEIDELSDRSLPDYYRNAVSLKERQYHERRELLYKVMKKAGFCRHWGEWWHFSLGDQMWAWLENQENSALNRVARYGRVI